MNENIDAPVVITAQEVSESLRGQMLPLVFGPSCFVAESAVYDALNELSTDYDGGFWQFYWLSNGGFYMAPTGYGAMRLQCAGNHFDDQMSSDAAGIVACLFAFNSLAWATGDARFGTLYYALRDYALEHIEARLILAAID